jgi:hypothetical protein
MRFNIAHTNSVEDDEVEVVSDTKHRDSFAATIFGLKT